MKHVTAGVVAALVTVALAGAQSPSTVSGRVVSAASGDPVPNARIAVTPAVPSAPVVLSDGNGRFSISIPAGQVKVVVSKSGYARTEMTPTGGPLELRLTQGAVITGRVVDSTGEPVARRPVLLEAAPVTAANAPPVSVTSTDDRGEYRFGGLSRGSFAVALPSLTVMTFALPGQARPTPERAYYPGVTELSEIQPIALQPGEERSGVDFVVPVDLRMLMPPVIVARLLQQGSLPKDPTASGIVRGRVTSADGRAVPHARVRLLGRTDVMQTQVSLADGGGRFEFDGVAKGSYNVGALKDGYATTEASALQFDLADGETHDRVDLTLSRLGTVSGVIVDELGDALQRASVQLLRIRYEAGSRHLVTAGEAGMTDEVAAFVSITCRRVSTSSARVPAVCRPPICPR